MTVKNDTWTNAQGQSIRVSNDAPDVVVGPHAATEALRTPTWSNGYADEMVDFERVIHNALSQATSTTFALGLDLADSFPSTPAAFVTFGTVLRFLQDQPDRLRTVSLSVPAAELPSFLEDFQEFARTMTGT